MGFIATKPPNHHLGEYVWIFFQASTMQINIWGIFTRFPGEMVQIDYSNIFQMG